jgi:SAM-dependent methyltransferase
MLELGKVQEGCDACEIGPGSGRYAVKIIEMLHPRTYEIYESARDWIPTLRALPNAVIRDCDGRTLAQTKDASVDLVHAQKVFVYIEFYASMGYLEEMVRVVRPGGIVAFDILTEDCLDEETVRAWVRQGSFYRPFPKDWTIEFMQRRGLDFVGSHFSPLPPGRAELLVFRRA